MKSIRIRDFRCFEDVTIDFRSGINLLVGNNGVGKTSLLQACKYTMSAFFSGYSDENTSWIGFSNDDFREIMRDGVVLPDRAVQIDFDMSDFWPDLSGTNYLKKNSKKNSRMLLEGLRDYKQWGCHLQDTLFDRVRNVQCQALPLFAFFSTEDIHQTRSISGNKFSTYHQKNSFGYYECTSSNGLFSYWVKRLLVLEEGHEHIQEVEIVRRAIHDVLGSEGCGVIDDIDIRPNQRKVYFLLTDGRQVPSEQLSDGYRRVANIVVDLAFRAALLNRGLYGTEACQQTTGTALIDEIDMHLHPSLQISILKALHRVFPRIQFIATTHAPLVMSGVENNDENVVYKMDYADGAYRFSLVHTYGLNISDIAMVVQGVQPRDATVDSSLAELFSLIDEERFNEAREKLESLKGDWGNYMPDLQKAETMIELMQ